MHAYFAYSIQTHALTIHNTPSHICRWRRSSWILPSPQGSLVLTFFPCTLVSSRCLPPKNVGSRMWTCETRKCGCLKSADLFTLYFCGDDLEFIRRLSIKFRCTEVESSVVHINGIRKCSLVTYVCFGPPYFLYGNCHFRIKHCFVFGLVISKKYIPWPKFKVSIIICRFPIKSEWCL